MDWDDLKSFFTLIFILMCTFFSFSLIGIGTIMMLVSVSCDKYSDVTGLETKMAFDTCMIKDPEVGWVSYDERLNARTAERGLISK